MWHRRPDGLLYITWNWNFLSMYRGQQRLLWFTMRCVDWSMGLQPLNSDSLSTSVLWLAPENSNTWKAGQTDGYKRKWSRLCSSVQHFLVLVLVWQPINSTLGLTQEYFRTLILNRLLFFCEVCSYDEDLWTCWVNAKDFEINRTCRFLREAHCSFGEGQKHDSVSLFP